MTFDGIRYRTTRTVVPLPTSHWKDGVHVTFGKVLKRRPDDKYPKSAVKTTYFRQPEGTDTEAERLYVWATPIRVGGHPLTNCMNGVADRYGWYKKYLLYNGKVYVASMVIRTPRMVADD